MFIKITEIIIEEKPSKRTFNNIRVVGKLEIREGSLKDSKDESKITLLIEAPNPRNNKK